ncbi:hypothetical protein [Lutispora sp.]|uniref:hypothetical protein n=1 Tax=Lutispora sp. TaxID=2828727 RepID=UPI0035699993
MIAKKYSMLIFLVSLSLLLFVGCQENEDFTNKHNSIGNEHVELDDIEDNQNTKINTNNLTTKSPDNNESTPLIFGTWTLEKVVLISEILMFPSEEDDSPDLVDNTEKYVGLELEYTDKYLRLGGEKFFNPKYNLKYMTIPEYNDGGKFKQPSLYDVISNENINITNSEKYEWLSEVPLEFYQVNFDEDYPISVGTQVVVLNDDTMLVGVWGKIILARRVEP